MNKLMCFAWSIVIWSSCTKDNLVEPAFYTCDFTFADSSFKHPNHTIYQNLLDQITMEGAVGITMAVNHPETGMWVGASGKADLYNDIDMKSCNISRVGSTVKMFTAVTILKLAEEGKVSLDDKISSHLGLDNLDKIENADKATIRQLLQHSSGIYNYIQSLEFQTASINDLIREWDADDLLSFAHHKAAVFMPGTDVEYSNTNYILLGMLIEKIEGKPFYEVFKEKLFVPLHLTMTRFASGDPVPDGIVRGYIDLYSNLQVIESTYFSGWDYYTADGGLISNPYDLANFFTALMHGQILNPSTLDEMLAWQTPKAQDEEFFSIDYGLGIFRMHTPQGIAYFHSGDAVGYYANMIFFPEDNTTIVYASNSNYGKIDELLSTRTAIEKILLVTR